MAARPLPSTLFVLFFFVGSARAATLEVTVQDTRGTPAENAVVSLEISGASGSGSHLPSEAVIDQRKETFLPLVTIVRTGARVVFTNNDTTMHQVYSFSPIKQFAFEIDEGHRSEPVVFDKPGVASIGCNIHDQMITYVYVASTPWAALTDAKGHAIFRDLPSGNYNAIVWHPQLVPGRPMPGTGVVVSGDGKLSLVVPLMAIPVKKHMHMGSY